MQRFFNSNFYSIYNGNKFSIYKLYLIDMNFILRFPKFFFSKHHEFQNYKNLGQPVRKRVKTKHIYHKNVPKIEEETPNHEGREDLTIEIPVRRENLYLKEIPKVNRYKNNKAKREIENKRIYTQYLNENRGSEDMVELPETVINKVLTPNTPTTKIRYYVPNKRKIPNIKK